jgi:hypothetical protein
MSNKLFQYAGVAASVVLIALGVGAIAVGSSGHGTVRDNLAKEQIVGTPDMTPKGIAAEAKAAHLPASINLPTCSVAGLAVNSGDRAHCFASYMRIHALEATGGQVYAQMPRYATDDGSGTDDPALASKDANGQPVSNPVRDVWINETALAGALNSAYMADKLSLFGIVVGAALLLSGIGFIVLALGALRPATTAAKKSAPGTVPVTA